MAGAANVGGSGGAGSPSCDQQQILGCYARRDAACTADPRSDACHSLLVMCDEMRLACEPVPASCEVSLERCYDVAMQNCIATPDPELCGAWFEGCDRLAQACFAP